MSIGSSFFGFPRPFVLLPASWLPPCSDVARYAFGKGDSHDARQQNAIALDSTARFGLNGLHFLLTFLLSYGLQ